MPGLVLASAGDRLHWWDWDWVGLRIRLWGGLLHRSEDPFDPRAQADEFIDLCALYPGAGNEDVADEGKLA